MVFSKLDCKPCWRERLPEIEVPHARRPRPPRPILPRRQRRGDRARDPRGAAARPRGGRHCDPRCGGRRGRRGDARARVEDGACRAAVGVGGSKRPRGRARARRSALAEPSKRGSEESRQGRSGRLLHAVKERIEALWWHGNDQHGLSCDRSRTRTLKASPSVRRTYDAGGGVGSCDLVAADPPQPAQHREACGAGATPPPKRASPRDNHRPRPPRPRTTRATEWSTNGN